MKHLLPVCLLCVASTPAIVAQEVPQPTAQHNWLKAFVGSWQVEGEGVMGEGQPPLKSKAVIKSEMVGGFWVVNRMEGSVADMRFTGLQTIGYDEKKKKYVGTWIDSMGGFMWQ